MVERSITNAASYNSSFWEWWDMNEALGGCTSATDFPFIWREQLSFALLALWLLLSVVELRWQQIATLVRFSCLWRYSRSGLQLGFPPPPPPWTSVRIWTYISWGWFWHSYLLYHIGWILALINFNSVLFSDIQGVSEDFNAEPPPPPLSLSLQIHT